MPTAAAASNPTPARCDPSRWVDDHGDCLYRLALRHARDAHRAEELVQETLLAALQARDGFRGESTVRTWLVGILRHKMIDEIRRRDRLTEIDPDAIERLFDRRGVWRRKPRPVEALDEPDAAAERDEVRGAIRACLEKLPPRNREVVLLVERTEAPAATVGQALGISATNVWTIVYRSRTMLRDCLERALSRDARPKES